MTSIIRHRTVMHINETQKFDDVRSFNNSDPLDEPGTVPEVCYIAKSTWDEMGQPEIVTMTIEPFDTLNTIENDN